MKLSYELRSIPFNILGDENDDTVDLDMLPAAASWKSFIELRSRQICFFFFIFYQIKNNVQFFFGHQPKNTNKLFFKLFVVHHALLIILIWYDGVLNRCDKSFIWTCFHLSLLIFGSQFWCKFNNKKARGNQGITKRVTVVWSFYLFIYYCCCWFYYVYRMTIRLLAT